MNVCFIYFKYPLYPKGSYFQEFLNRLAQSVEKIYLIASQYPKGNFEKSENIKMFWVPLLRIKYLGEIFFIFACLFRAIFSKGLSEIELVNTVGPRGLLAGWYLKKRYKIPLVCIIEMLNEKGNFYNNLYYRVVRFLMTKIPIDKFICWSNYYWEKHLSDWGVHREKIEIIPCGIDTQRYNPSVDGSEIKHRYAPDTPLIVFAKPLYRENTEAVKILVQSIKLSQTKMRVKLLIGDGEGKRDIKTLAKKLGIENLVDFMPPTKFTDIPRYIAASDIIVLPFVYVPTTSRSLLEAMAMGKPIITTNVGEIGNILKDREDVIFSTLCPEEIAESIIELIENKELREYLGKNARDLVIKRFALQNIVRRELDVFKELVNETNN